MSRSTARLVQLLHRLAPLEGYNLTSLPDVRLLRSNRPLLRTPVLYEPGIVIVAQGCKRGFFGDEVYIYDARHYLAVSVPVPFTMETDASAAKPLLAVYLQLDFKVIAELMMQMDALQAVFTAEPKGMYSSPMDSRLEHTVIRLLEALSHPLDAQMLAPSLVREIYYRVLMSEQGASIRAALSTRGQFAKISRALKRIHATYDRPLNVAQLARAAAMSVPSFHAHFKTVTRISPMQYLKSTRLHQARLLMLRQGLTATAACSQVGYQSPSQFNREFKRLFGRTPSQEVARVKQTFAMPPPTGKARFVSSH